MWVRKGYGPRKLQQVRACGGWGVRCGILTNLDELVVGVVPEESIREERYYRIHGWHVQDAQSIGVEDVVRRTQ